MSFAVKTSYDLFRIEPKIKSLHNKIEMVYTSWLYEGSPVIEIVLGVSSVQEFLVLRNALLKQVCAIVTNEVRFSTNDKETMKGVRDYDAA